jgi:beta-mannosidase
VAIARTVEKNRENDRPRQVRSHQSLRVLSVTYESDFRVKHRLQFYEFGAFQTRNVYLDIWGSNASDSPVKATLVVTAVDIANPTWHKRSPDVPVTLEPNASTDFHTKLPIPEPTENVSDLIAPSGTVVVQVKLVAMDGNTLALRCDWPQPYRFLNFPDPKLNIRREGERLIMTVQQPLKGLVLSLAAWKEGEAEVEFEDNGVSSCCCSALKSPIDLSPSSSSWNFARQLDLFPNDCVTVVAKGLADRPLRARYMGTEQGIIV